MAMKQIELILNNVLLAFQACLGLCQLIMLTPVGVPMQCVVVWLLRPLRQSPAYSRLQHCKGRVFRKANCFVLQAHTPSQRKVIEAADKLDTIRLWYLGRRFIMEKRGSEGNMLFVNGEMCYYITPRLWEELLNFGAATTIWEEPGLAGAATVDVAGLAGAATVDACADEPSTLAAVRVAMAPRYSATVFVKGYRQSYEQCWKNVMRGGVMTFEEVVEGIILDDQRVSNLLDDFWLLPINLSVSKDNFLKFLNLAGFFLHGKVHLLIPTSLSLISALMEFSTGLRMWFYTNINLLLCYIMHLKPSDGVELKSERAITRAIIAGGAKVDKEGATSVPWLEVADEENQICCKFNDITCNYVVPAKRCHISSTTINTLSVECKSMDEFRHIIILVSCMVTNGCGSLKSRGPDNKVFVRGFKESVLSYVKNGCPPVYELKL